MFPSQAKTLCKAPANFVAMDMYFLREARELSNIDSSGCFQAIINIRSI